MVETTHLVHNAVPQESALRLEFSQYLDMIRRRAVVECRDGRVVRYLFGNIEAFAAILVVVSTSEDLAENGVVAVVHDQASALCTAKACRRIMAELTVSFC